MKMPQKSFYLSVVHGKIIDLQKIKLRRVYSSRKLTSRTEKIESIHYW